MTMKYSNKDGVKEKSKRKLSASSKLKIINFSKSSEEKDKAQRNLTQNYDQIFEEVSGMKTKRNSIVPTISMDLSNSQIKQESIFDKSLQSISDTQESTTVTQNSINPVNIIIPCMSDIKHLKVKLIHCINTLKQSFYTILFPHPQISYFQFQKSLKELLSLTESEAEMFSAFLLDINPKSKRISMICANLDKFKNKIKEFIGDVKQDENLLDDIKELITKTPHNARKFASDLEDLSKCETTTILNIVCCLSLNKIEIDPLRVISYLLEESKSSSIVNQNSLCKFSRFVRKSVSEALIHDDSNIMNYTKSLIGNIIGKTMKENHYSFEEMTERGQNLFIMLSDFLYENKTSLFRIIHPLVFSKMIDGKEHQLIKLDYLYQALEDAVPQGSGCTITSEASSENVLSCRRSNIVSWNNPLVLTSRKVRVRGRR